LDSSFVIRLLCRAMVEVDNAVAACGSRRVCTLEWVDWFNHRRLLERMGDTPPMACEQQPYQAQETPAMVAEVK